MKDNNFIVIKGWMRTKLKLKANKLILFAIIYGYSQDGVSKCKSSITYIQEALGVSRNTAIKTRKELLDKNYIVKSKDGSVFDYSANIELVNNLLVQKLTPASAETEPVASAETEPNIYNNIYTNKNIESSFETIWNLYNYKKGKKKALLKFETIAKNNSDLQLLVESIKKAIPNYLEHLAAETWKQQKQLEFWLNGECWNDEYTIKKTGKQTNIIHAQSDKYANVPVTKATV
jgi:hypothetical protein